MARWNAFVLADGVVTLPVFLMASWAAFANPFTGEKTGMVVTAGAALLVMLPSVLLLCDRALSTAWACLLSLVYGVMLAAGGYVLFYELTYGPW